MVYLYTGILLSNTREKVTLMDSCNNMCESQRYFVKWKKLEPKGIILYDSIYMTFWERRNYWDRRQIWGCQEWGVGRGWSQRGSKQEFLGWWNFLDHDCDGIHSSMHLSKSIEIYITKSELCKFKTCKVLLLISSLIPLWSESRHCMISIFLNLLRCFMSQDVVYLGECSMQAWEESVICYHWMKCSIDVNYI